MSYKNEKLDAAMRLFSVLSEVDETYLAACEEDDRANIPFFTRVTGFMHRYGGAVAAVLCLAMLGGSLWVYQGRNSGKTNFTSQDSANGGQSMAQADGAEMQESNWEAMEGADAAGIEMEEAAVAGGGEYIALPQDNPATGEQDAKKYPAELETGKQEAALSPESKTDSMDQHTAMTNSVTEGLSGASGLSLSDAAGLEVVGGYLPDSWPAQGDISLTHSRDASGYETLVVNWSYGNDQTGFSLVITDTGNTDTESTVMQNLLSPTGAIEDSSPVFMEEDFTEECVRTYMTAQSENDSDTSVCTGNFAVLYLDDSGRYVEVAFNGSGDVEEIWKMMKSIGE